MSKAARDYIRESLMKERECRKPCWEIRGCDCATDTIAILTALKEHGFAIVPVEEQCPEVNSATSREQGMNQKATDC